MQASTNRRDHERDAMMRSIRSARKSPRRREPKAKQSSGRGAVSELLRSKAPRNDGSAFVAAHVSFSGRAAILVTLLALALLSASPLAAKGGRSSGILPGASAKDPLDIDAGKLDYFDKEQRLVYSGGVVVINGPSTLKASKLTIFLDPKGPGDGDDYNDRVKHIDAEGPVTMVTKDRIGSGDKGSYDRVENKVYLTGNVTLSQGENVTKGDRLVYDISTGEAAVQGGQAQNGRVHSTFKPGEVKDVKPEETKER